MRNLRNNIAKLVIAITPLVQACTNNTQKQGYDTLTETENISASIDSTKDTRIDINNKENSDTIHREKIQNQEIPSTLEKININELENIVR
ncbi:hypothetical protein GW750_06025 [bacterium]|nr:hypothetical protein [bacterium]